MNGRKRAAIIGATGYGGAELLRLLLAHPHIEITRIAAKSEIGVRIDQLNPALRGFTDLIVEDAPPADIAKDADVVFLALPHRVSALIGAEYVALGVKVVDLSGDWRLLDAELYSRYYGVSHPFPERLGSFVYGMPEMNREAIASADHVASPGCFATATTLALLPFARAGLLNGRVHVSAMTGSSGSGVRASAGTHHPVRAVNLKPYKPLVHQHTPEIEQSLHLSGAPNLTIDFVPVSAPLSRGILTTCFFEVPAAVEPSAIVAALDDCYGDESLIRIIKTGLPQVASIKGSIYCDVAVSVGETVVDGRRTVVAHSALDNLVKGGAGQAVQAMNLMLGFPEGCGISAQPLWP
ncbi:MAG: N-acetyl-gamma-glutamyl-phosphate reductase [Myxococcales bacterium]|nr:N-acetyl-gamma-glutamyl-phosphate reductase [Myxococcales bacterium]